MEDLEELIEQYDGGMLTEKEFWGKVSELATNRFNELPEDEEEEDEDEDEFDEELDAEEEV